MNNGELYKQAFGALHAPDTVSLTAGKGAERKTLPPGTAACARLRLHGAGARPCRDSVCPRRTDPRPCFRLGNDMEITTGVDENGESCDEVRLHTEDLTPPVVQRGGRMIFIVNNESIDITGELSPDEGVFPL